MPEQVDKIICIYTDGDRKYLVRAEELDDTTAMIVFLKKISGGKGLPCILIKYGHHSKA